MHCSGSVYLCWILSMQFMRTFFWQSLFISIQIYRNSLQVLHMYRTLLGAVANSLLLQCQFSNFKVFNHFLLQHKFTSLQNSVWNTQAWIFPAVVVFSFLSDSERSSILRMSADIQSQEKIKSYTLTCRGHLRAPLTAKECYQRFTVIGIYQK